MDMLTAFHNQGLRVIFYYHDGHDDNPSTEWNAFWDVSPTGYYAEKAAAINSWLNIVGEIGTRYGTLLDGWMFDDGATYYPAPYTLVNSVLREGNQNRMSRSTPTATARDTPTMKTSPSERQMTAPPTLSTPTE